MDLTGRPFFLRPNFPSLVGAEHRSATWLLAGTTELGQALMEGLGSDSGRKQSPGLDLVPSLLSEAHLKNGKGELGPLGVEDGGGFN